MGESVDDVERGREGERFTFRCGSWLGKALAFVTVMVFAAAVVWYWRPLGTWVGWAGMAVLIAMALATAVWWHVRVQPVGGGEGRGGKVTWVATLLGIVPVWWRSVEADRLKAVRLSAQRQSRRWHDVWYVSVVRDDGRTSTLHWQTLPRTDEPTEAWELAQRVARALGVPAENKGIQRVER